MDRALVLMVARVATQGTEVTRAEAPCEYRVVGVAHYVLKQKRGHSVR